MMKKVLVWGTGVNALDFVKGHRSLEIIAYIDNRKKDKEWGGYPNFATTRSREYFEKIFCCGSSIRTYILGDKKSTKYIGACRIF